MNETYCCPTLSLLPDEDLVHRFRQGEDDAFDQLYARYRRRILQTTYRITRNTDDAQDAAQEIFLKLYRCLRSWDVRKARLSTWIYRLATNHAIDAWRSRERRTRPLTEEDASDVSTLAKYPDHGPSPLAALQQKEQLLAVVRCTDRLSRIQKRLFLQRYFYGMSMEELSRREGLRLGTVKGLLHRATRRIRSSPKLNS